MDYVRRESSSCSPDRGQYARHRLSQGGISGVRNFPNMKYGLSGCSVTCSQVLWRRRQVGNPRDLG